MFFNYALTAIIGAIVGVAVVKMTTDKDGKDIIDKTFGVVADKLNASKCATPDPNPAPAPKTA